MRRAFVSHSTADDSFVAEMESFLRAAGYDEVFNDVSAIRPDEQFWPEIEKGIANADTLVIVITSASNASEWVAREVDYARGLSKKIIPVWIEDCPVPPIFADRDVIDFRPRTRAERRFEISRIIKYAPAELIGREDKTKLLNEAWQKVLRIEKGRPHVLTFVALGGEGKTSLVAKWAAELAHQDWPGCDAAFAWSFYSQGTREQVAASSDLFLKEALTFFGDDADRQFAASPAGAFEKGQRLARIVGQRRSLLILDGLEPLQYAPTSPTPGQLKDQGIAALLRALAAASRGLCVVTTRYSLPDLRAFWQTTAPEVKLLRLSRAAGVHLLQSFGVKGSLLRDLSCHGEQVNEFEELVEDAQGHALTLNLLGTYLRDAHAGDIRKRGLVKLEEADAEEQGGHAFRVMKAYEREFEREGDKGQRALAVLRLLGLFDRPLASDCLGALLQAPAIPELTEPLVGVTEAQRNIAFTRLENARLLTVNRDASGALETLDAHPLLREYFARQLHTRQPDSWRAAHRRLYEHLCATTPDKPQPTLEDLQPLYQAVAHGCQADLWEETYTDVLRKRIYRDGVGREYTWTTLGIIGSDLSGLARFFERPFSLITSSLSVSSKGEVLGLTGFLFCLSGQLEDGLKLLREASRHEIAHERWLPAARTTALICTYELLMGHISRSVADAGQAGRYAMQSVEPEGRVWELRYLGSLGDAYHQAGNTSNAQEQFSKLDQLRNKFSVSPGNPVLLGFFQHCDFLSAPFECAAWKSLLRGGSSPKHPANEPCDEVYKIVKIAKQGLTWAIGGHVSSLIGYNLLTLFRVELYQMIAISDTHSGRTETVNLSVGGENIDEIVNRLRNASVRNMLVHGLLTRAWLRILTGARTGPDGAQADLDEAWEIAERGPMRLHMADIHLHRARLFFREAQYPWESLQADLAAAEKLINDCGYHRRDEELADAKAAILSR